MSFAVSGLRFAVCGFDVDDDVVVDGVHVIEFDVVEVVDGDVVALVVVVVVVHVNFVTQRKGICARDKTRSILFIIWQGLWGL